MTKGANAMVVARRARQRMSGWSRFMRNVLPVVGCYLDGCRVRDVVLDDGTSWVAMARVRRDRADADVGGSEPASGVLGARGTAQHVGLVVDCDVLRFEGDLREPGAEHSDGALHRRGRTGLGDDQIARHGTDPSLGDIARS